MRPPTCRLAGTTPSPEGQSEHTVEEGTCALVLDDHLLPRIFRPDQPTPGALGLPPTQHIMGFSASVTREPDLTYTRLLPAPQGEDSA